MKEIKHTYFIFFIAVFFNINSSAGQDSLKNSFSISANIALPLGAFKSTSYTNHNAGYAKLGIGAQLEYSRKIFSQLSILTYAGYYKNKVDNAAVASQIKAITEEQTGSTTIFAASSSTFWENYYITAGFSYQWRFCKNKKMALEPFITAGTSYCVTPAASYSVRIDNLTFETRSSKANTWGFTHNEGLKVNYLLNQKTKISFNMSYMNTSGSGTNREHIVVGNGTYTRSYSNYNINNSVFLVGIGAAAVF